MKRVILFAISLCFALFINAQVSKTLDVTAGGLSSSLTATDLSTVTNLTLTGTIDARDFKIMRDEMPVLAVLDLSQVTIQAYSGAEGTDATQSVYPTSELPRYSFCKITSGVAQGKWSLTSVILPNNITSIGKNAFGGCFYLTGNLVIPNSVTTIGDYAYDACFGLAGTLTLSNSLVSIGRGAFSSCSAMTGSLTIPNSVTTIGSNAFSGCSRLDGTLTLPANLISISDSAFYFCSRLTGNLSIPATVSSIGSFAFGNCGGFTGSLVLPTNLTSLGSYAFYGGKFTGTLTIPTSITEIKDGTFAFGLGYSSVVFPSVLTKIGKSAFESCSAWTGVLSLPTTVSSIGDVAFSSCSKLTGVIFPETLTSIGSSAFSGCIGLQGTLTIPNSVSTIGETTFQSCTGLTAVNLPSTFLTIPYGLFKYCSGLSGKFIVPESTTSIGFAAFASCTALNSINIPNSVTAIYQAAFSKCTSLASIWNYCQIPVNLSSAPYVFENVNQAVCILYVPVGTKAAYQSANKWQDFANIVEMPSLSLSASTASLAATLGNNVTVGLTSNTTWTASSDQAWLTVSPTSGTGNLILTFTAEINLIESARTATVTVTSTGLAPQTVSVTQQAMVKGAKIVAVTAGGLKTVLTADELVSITNLTLTGTIDARDFVTMKSMSALAVLNLSGTTVAAYATNPENTIPDNALQGCTTLTTINLPLALTKIGRLAFSSLWRLKTVTIPSTVTFIGDQAFRGCEGITAIDLPSELITLDFSAFEDCYTLLSITIPSKVTTIGYEAFFRCYALKSVILPSSLSSIDVGVFQGCGSLETIDFPSTLTSIGIQAFYGTGLKNITLPQSLKTIGESAFKDCGSLISVFIPASVTMIGNYAFTHSTGLKNVDPANLNYSSIDGVLFDKSQTTLIHCPMSMAGSYTIPSTVSIIDLSAFERCGNLTSITIPPGVTTIKNSGFRECGKLTTLSIPSSVTSIGSSAFYFCTGLTSFYANPLTPVDLTSSIYAFYNVNTSICILHVPSGSLSAYQLANQWSDFTHIVEMPLVATWTGATSTDWNKGTNWTSGSVPTSGTNVTIPIGVLNYPVIGTATTADCNNLTVESGASLTIQSSSSGIGTLITNGTVTGSGTTSVEQYLSSTRNWDISSPLSSATAPTGYTYFQYNEAGDNTGYKGSATAYWKSVSVGDGLSVGRGYIAQLASGASTLALTGGTLNTGDKTLSLTRTTGKDKEGFNMVGNPYPSYLNIDDLASNTDIESSFWYRSKTTSYVYDTYNIPGAISTGNSGFQVSSNIPPMQAFWLRVKSGKTTASVVLKNANRGHQDNSNNKFRAPAANNSTQQLLRLQVSNGTNSDEAVVYFNPNASDSYDTFDSPKMSNNNVAIPELYTTVGNEKLVINGMKSVSQNSELPLGFTTGSKNTFTIKATEINNFDASTRIILKDKLLNTEQELTNGGVYTFTSDIANSDSRFSIVFKSASAVTGIDDTTDSKPSLAIFRNPNGYITITCNDAASKGTVTVCNALGQKLTECSTAGTTTVINRSFLPGVYLLTLNVSGRTTTKKIILN